MEPFPFSSSDSLTSSADSFQQLRQEVGNQDSGGEDDEHDQHCAASPQSELSPGQDVSNRDGGGEILLLLLSVLGGAVSLEILTCGLNCAELVLGQSRACKVTPERLVFTKPVANWD